MEFLSAGLQIVGLGLSIFGASEQADNAKAQAQVSMDIARQEMGINEEKQKAMELSARRQQLETYRNTQRARAQATAAAVNQGAGSGSGLQGGLAQIANQGIFNLVGIDSALQTGRNINVFNQAISQDKIKLAELGGEAADAQMWSGIGGALTKSGRLIGQMAQGFNFNLFGSSGNYSGTPGASNTGGFY
jgi:hypothetical protein